MTLPQRILLLVLCLSICLGGISAVFWKQELKYQLPTPVPADYHSVAVGQQVALPAALSKDKAYFLHFYNPDCPCSRFNTRHLQSLIGTYRDSISIVVVVPSEEDIEKAQSEFGSALQILVDESQAIAKSCGVYSTPQAVIVDNNQNLFYRGNYNRSRYCTARASNFAELSLIALINRRPPPAFGLAATQSYGCELNNADLEFF